MKIRDFKLSLLAASVLPLVSLAGNIQVTTTEDITANDGQCSLREAITQSNNVSVIRNAEKAKFEAEEDLEAIDELIRSFELSEIYGEPEDLCADLASVNEDPEVNASQKEQLGEYCAERDGLVEEIETQDALIESLEEGADDCEDVDGTLDTVLLDAGETYTLLDQITVTAPVQVQTEFYVQEIDNLAVIQSDGSSRHFYVNNERAVELSLSGVVLDGGNANNISTDTFTFTGLGGSIFTNSVLNLEEVVIQNSSAIQGGGIYLLSSARANISDASFFDNTASGSGGAIFSSGDLLISALANGESDSNVYQGNHADNFGGAIFANEGSFSLDEVKIGTQDRGNTAGKSGGGIAIVNPQIEVMNINIQRSSIIGNEALGEPSSEDDTGYGGGLLVQGVLSTATESSYTTTVTSEDGSTATTTVVTVQITDYSPTNLTLENTTIAQNSSTVEGGGFYGKFSGERQINNITLVENSAPVASGISQIGLEPNIEFILYNSVIAFNEGGIDCHYELSPFATYFQDDYSESDTIFRYGVFGNLTTCLAPLFPEVENNKSTEGYVLTDFFNPPFNNIDNAYIPLPIDALTAVETRIYNAGGRSTEAESCKNLDQRSISRYVEDTLCDIGAIEHQPTQATKDVYESLDQGEQYCLGVLGNDVNDGSINFADEADVQARLQILSEPEFGGSVEVVTECPEGAIAQDDYLEQDIDGNGVVDAEEDGVPRVGLLYAPPDIFGQESLDYIIELDGSPGVKQSAEVILNITPPDNSFPNYSRGAVTGFGSFDFFMAFGLAALAGAMRFRKVLAGLMIAASCFISQAFAAEIIVDTCEDPGLDDAGNIPKEALDDEFCSLREALYSSRNNSVNLAQACESGEDTARDIIVLKTLIEEEDGAFEACDGQPYAISSELELFSRATIECEDWDSKSQSELCVIQPTEGTTTRLLSVKNNASTLIRGIEFKDGNTTAAGGAIFTLANLTLNNVKFTNNQAAQGGAIMLQGVNSSIEAVKSVFIGNSAISAESSVEAAGGAIASAALNEHRVSIVDSSFINNTVDGGSGGAMHLAGTDQPLELNSVTFYQNRALPVDTPSQGGALYISNFPGDITFNNLTFIANEADEGAGVYGLNEADRNSELKVYNSIFDNEGINCADDDPGYKTLEDRVYFYNRADDDSCTPLLSEETPTITYNDLSEEQQKSASQNDLVGLSDGLVYREDLAMPVLVPNTDVLINQNNEVSAIYACTEADQLGLSRAAGGACDIGAVEKQELTAVDDFPGQEFSPAVSSNVYINPNSCRQLVFDNDPDLDISTTQYYATGRSVIVDVLENDIADLATGINTASVTQIDGAVATTYQIDDPALYDFLIAPSEQERYSESQLEECLQDRKDNFSDYVLLVENDDRVLGVQTLTYSVESGDGLIESTATVTVDIDNIPPQARDDEVRIAVGTFKTRIDLTSNDTDDDSISDTMIDAEQCARLTVDTDAASDADLVELGLNRETIYLTNPNPTSLETDDLFLEKIVIVDPPIYGSLELDKETCEVFYITENIFQTANDFFTYEVADYEEDEFLSNMRLSNTARVDIIMTGPGTQDQVNQLPNSLTKNGSFDWFLLLGLTGLLFLRRKNR
ncbi:MAG: CSLREA domain-containing protein [Pseudomonadota bacterium]|nr:CSLREA domain-containing protein [Pseudomonadota bacterium]